MITKKFPSKDVLFNNGIVNFYKFLEESELELEKELNAYNLILKIDEDKENEIYLQILISFIKKYGIVYQTKNKRWYFDENKKDFILDNKFDTIGGQKNDLRNGVYLYKNISEFNLTREEVEKLYLDFCEKNSLKPEKDSNGKLKVPNAKNEVIVVIPLDEAIERFAKYLVKSDFLKIDSKIHTFEDGQKTFQSMLKIPNSYKINKWDALIYWFGGRIQRFYNDKYYIYPNSSNLISLKIFKEHLNILDKNIEIRDEKGNIKIINTNINFKDQLEKDNIFNPNFYISKSQEEFEVKFFMYLFSVIFHIEEQYEKANKRRKATRKLLYDTLQYISFVVYTDDGTFKVSFNEYTKAYMLIKFFEILKKFNLFEYLADILVTFSLSQKSNEVNLSSQKWCKNLLDFKSLRKEVYLASFNILKNEKKPFGKRLFEFEKLYLEKILKGEGMDIHTISKTIGDGIGLFCAELGEKDLLFKLRNIKNYKQLLGYFRDLKFAVLKNEEKAKFSKEFNEALNELLKDIESNWEIARDYIAIYAIDKYRSVTFAKGGK